MGSFCALLFIPILIQHIGIRGVEYKKKNKWALNVFFVLYVCLLMFRRVDVGKDTSVYVYYFSKYANMQWEDLVYSVQEIGFVYFCKIISMISMNSQVFLAIASAVTIILMVPTYRRLCVDASLTIVLFCTMSTFVMMFSGIRQMISVAIGLVAYEFTRKKKFLKFLMAVFVATTFHVSAFMLLFMYPVYHAKITKKWIKYLVPFLGIIFALNKSIFEILNGILEKISRFSGSLTSTGAYAMLILFVVFAIFAFLVPDEQKLDEETVGLRNFLILSVIIQMFAPLHTLAMRMNYYYIIFIPLLLPKIIVFRNKKWAQVAYLGRNIMVIFFLIYFFFCAYQKDALNVFPYHFFWE